MELQTHVGNVNVELNVFIHKQVLRILKQHVWIFMAFFHALLVSYFRLCKLFTLEGTSSVCNLHD